MIQAILFDLDGVLIDADKWHFNALNVALQHAAIDPISWNEHLTIYKGIPTRKKLEILTERKGLDRHLWDKIQVSKQDTTVNIINQFCSPDPEKIEMMALLRRRYRIAVCSNAVRASVALMLEKSGLMPYVDFYLSNEDVAQPKPDPEIYLTAFSMLGLEPEQCVIVEDSDVGKLAANASGAILCSVAGPEEVNYYRVGNTIAEANQVNVVIPAAGQGKRFSEVGQPHPKPLIDVHGRPMLAWVLDNFRAVGRPIVILQKKQIQRYCADDLVQRLNPSAVVLETDGLTQGAVCTVLLAKDLIDNANELIIANSDQYVDLDVNDFVNKMRNMSADGGILTFDDDHPKWSYARTDNTGRVVEVAEKIVISRHATVGIYYFRRGADFVSAAQRMMAKNIRVNGEFYTCPVFNELITEGAKIFIHEIDKAKMHGMGTPEDLARFTPCHKETTIIQIDTAQFPMGDPVISRTSSGFSDKSSTRNTIT